MNKTKLLAIGVLFAVASFFAAVGLTSAQSFKTGETASVGSGETVDSMLFAAGTNVDIAGTVNGDVYCAGQTITISGTVNGDVFCAGQTVSVSGTIEGSARLAGQTVNLGGNIDRSATVAAQTFLLESDGTIERDLLGGVETLTVNGEVGRDVTAGATTLAVNGTVGRDITSQVENIVVGSDGNVGGNVEYTSANEITINDGGVIAGETTQNTPSETKSGGVEIVAVTFGWIVYMLIALLVVAMALVLLIPQILHESAGITISKPGKTALTGFVAVILAPIAIIALFISVIGIPLAILALLIWLTVIFLSGPFAGYTLGRVLMKDSKRPVLIMLLGSSILLLIYFIPFIGGIAMLAAYIFGVGMILQEAGNKLPKPQQKV